MRLENAREETRSGEGKEKKSNGGKRGTKRNETKRNETKRGGKEKEAKEREKWEKPFVCAVVEMLDLSRPNVYSLDVR